MRAGQKEEEALEGRPVSGGAPRRPPLPPSSLPASPFKAEKPHLSSQSICTSSCISPDPSGTQVGHGRGPKVARWRLRDVIVPLGLRQSWFGCRPPPPPRSAAKRGRTAECSATRCGTPPPSGLVSWSFGTPSWN
ncbi:hypothetical protein SEVIR_9G402700v4 [Setaria viridis]|uniref:Uncharacterized protein n=1 Tax=Setaria viridis TaxID=4556 RepID=A0A4U6T312_SETVI|nr:hypothetical protein SEVIR_9G402700v2 [Setaria viridis]